VVVYRHVHTRTTVLYCCDLRTAGRGALAHGEQR